MELYGLTRKDIKSLAVLNGDYYTLTVGSEVEVTVVRKINSNNVLTSSLSKSKLEDKFMTKYKPNNIIYFDKDFVDSEKCSNYVSCQIDRKSCTVFVGSPEKYLIKSGVLATTGILSLNGFVQKQRNIFYSSQLSGSSAKNKITLLSVGLRGDNLFGLYHIPRERGLAISVDDSESMGLSVVSEKIRDCWNWGILHVDDWFDRCKVQAV